MRAIVLAGGLGTRLRERVADRPKALAPVAGRPFIQYLLDGLAAAGVTHVTLATGYLGEMVQACVGESHGGMPVSYSREMAPLGTGGAIVQAMAQLPDAPVLILNGDTWFGLDLKALVAWCAKEPERDAIALRQVADTSRYATVALQGERIVEFGGPSSPGPGLINGGIYWLRRASLERFVMPPVFSIENDFFKPHAQELGMRGFVSDAHFIDIGVPQDYDRAQIVLPQWAAIR